MSKQHKTKDQYVLPLDPPAVPSTTTCLHSTSISHRNDNNQNDSLSCKLFNISRAIQKKNERNEKEVLERILSHSAALEW